MAELARYDRLLEVGVGDRPAVARALVARGRNVTAIDVAVDPNVAGDAETDVLGDRVAAGDRAAAGDADGSLRVRHGDVVALADAPDPAARIGGSGAAGGVDAVYGLRLPAELQRPTVNLADRLGAACSFTTLGFEEPVVPVERRQIGETTLYVAREREGE